MKPKKVKAMAKTNASTGIVQRPISTVINSELTDRSLIRRRICSSHDCELILSPAGDVQILRNNGLRITK